MELKGSKTEENLLASFAGESMARSRYNFYAEQARKDGYEQIAALFDLTAENERAHAKQVLKYLNGIGTTTDNLQAAAYGEHEEWSELYNKSAEVAYEEGFTEIGKYFENVCKVEKDHEERFLELKKNIEQNEVFKKGAAQIWVCRVCGYIHYGEEAPKVCPVCKHPQAFYEIQPKNY